MRSLWFPAGWITRIWSWTYEFEIRYPNPHRPEGFSSTGAYVGRAYLSEHAAGVAMEKHIRALTRKLSGMGAYTADEKVRKL